jgi:hypothetical protein
VYLDVVETGDGDGTLENGESASMTVGVYNGGDGALLGGEVVLSASGANVSITTGTVAVDAVPGQMTLAGPFTFDVIGAGPLDLSVTYRDDSGDILTQALDLDRPEPPSDTWSQSGVSDVRVNWIPSPTGDVIGYNLYQGNPGAPRGVTRVNQAPIVGGFGVSLGLAALTSYTYQVAAIDGSGNESELTPMLTASTSPPANSGFPVALTGAQNRSSPTFVDLDGDGSKELIFGSDYLYVLRADGTAYIDGDGAPATVGVFSEEDFTPDGNNNLFWGKPAVADIDLDGRADIVAAHFSTGKVYAWDGVTGLLKWGGDTHDIGQNCWSSPAIGNIDNDDELEIVLWSGSNTGAFKGAICAFNHDGSEVVNGDGDGATNGIFWSSPETFSEFNYGSVALFDFDGDGRDEIVAGERNGSQGVVHVLDWDTGGVVAELPGWPANAGANSRFSSSPAVVDLVGDGNPGDYGIFITGLTGLYGYSATGTPLPGFPKSYAEPTISNVKDFLPSPVIGDLSGDGELDVVHGWEGFVYAYDNATGDPLEGWPVAIETAGQTFDSATFNGAMANLDFDLDREFIIGSGGGLIYAFNGDGSSVAGFPYAYGADTEGAPMVWDLDGGGTTDVVILGTQGRIASLELDGVMASTDLNVWPQFRHNSRNTGVYGSGFSTTPIDVGGVTVRSPAAGRVEIRWDAPGDYLGFDVERASSGAPRRRIGTVDDRDTDGRWGYVDTRAPAGGYAQYWIVGRTPVGTETAGPFGLLVTGGQAKTVLHQNAPNPFAPRTAIRFDVGGESGSLIASPVRLDVFDVVGRRVATLVNEARTPGTYQVEWDGTVDTGERAANGIYLYRLTVGKDVVTRKLTLRR